MTDKNATVGIRKDQASVGKLRELAPQKPDPKPTDKPNGK